MVEPEVERFLNLVRTGKKPKEAAEEAELTKEQAEDIMGMCVEILDSENFASSNYDLFIVERLRSLEQKMSGQLERIADRDDRIAHEINSMAKCTLELVKTVNRLVDAQKAPEIREEAITKVVAFPCTNPPKAS